jgi:hypothetical protein
MAQMQKQKKFEEAFVFLRTHSFDVQQVANVAGRVQARKYGCGAVLDRAGDGGMVCVSGPGCLIGGEMANIVDRGYQKFLKTSRVELPATADHLHSLHRFTEELREAAGAIILYNEALGTVSDLYQYDRLQGREHPHGISGATSSH